MSTVLFVAGIDEYRYFLKVVPTRIFHSGFFGGSTMRYQYSVTKTVCSYLLFISILRLSISPLSLETGTRF